MSRPDPSTSVAPTSPTRPRFGDAGPVDRPAAFQDWLIGQALPFWARAGVDRVDGGFFEKVGLDGRPLDEPRRTRVVARQVYVFAIAERRGWLPDADRLVDHGLAFLLDRSRRDDGTFAAAVAPDGRVVDDRFDLYEQAFALFALATAWDGRAGRAPLREVATTLLGRLRAGWAHPEAGFEEAAPRTLPLRSNPHMHLLEASLAWMEASEGDDLAPWQALASELVGLALRRFIDPARGSLHECFDGDWRRLPDDLGEQVEPGHQFEWAWLLMRWAALSGDREAEAAAARLLAIGEGAGVDRARGVAVNALGAGFRVTDAAAKVWPQTERIKAWQLATERAGDPGAVAASRERRDDAIAGLMRYVVREPAGIWHEVLGADGRFVEQPCRASSLYHIVCAADTLQPPLPRRPAALR